MIVGYRIAKDRFTGFQRRLTSHAPRSKLQNFKTDHFIPIVAAVMWLKFLPIRRKTLSNQSINQSINQSKSILECGTR